MLNTHKKIEAQLFAQPGLWSDLHNPNVWKPRFRPVKTPRNGQDHQTRTVWSQRAHKTAAAATLGRLSCIGRVSRQSKRCPAARSTVIINGFLTALAILVSTKPEADIGDRDSMRPQPERHTEKVVAESCFGGRIRRRAGVEQCVLHA